MHLETINATWDFARFTNIYCQSFYLLFNTIWATNSTIIRNSFFRNIKKKKIIKTQEKYTFHQLKDQSFQLGCKI